MHSSNQPDVVSVTEAARILGLSRRGVLHRIKAGTLPADKLGEHTAAFLIRRDDLPSDESRQE